MFGSRSRSGSGSSLGSTNLHFPYFGQGQCRHKFRVSGQGQGHWVDEQLVLFLKEFNGCSAGLKGLKGFNKEGNNIIQWNSTALLFACKYLYF